MAGKLETFQDFLINEPAQIDLSYLALSLIIAAILSFILGKLYIRYGTSISNRRKFASNFVLMTTTTTLIITVVKSSLALSLGLVGALSIVRFRAAIKEPEELAFLFLTIAIGLGLGANQIGVTILSFFIISLFIYGRHFYEKKEENYNLSIIISGKITNELNLKKISSILKKNCNFVHLKRFDKSEDNILEASFLVDFDSLEKLEKTKEELSNLSKLITISYLDKINIY
jgi:uncharacterized membrane protein YhiD involved in acid resistance